MQTLALVVVSTVVALIIAIPLGILAARKRRRVPCSGRSWT